jgi:hypothetical protein
VDRPTGRVEFEERSGLRLREVLEVTGELGRVLAIAVAVASLLFSIPAAGEEYWDDLAFAVTANAMGSLILYESLPLVMAGHSVLEEVHAQLPDLEEMPIWVQQMATDIEILITWFEGDIEAIPRRYRIGLIVRAIDGILPLIDEGMTRAELYRAALPGHEPLPISESISMEIILEPNGPPPKQPEPSFWDDLLDWISDLPPRFR